MIVPHPIQRLAALAIACAPCAAAPADDASISSAARAIPEAARTLLVVDNAAGIRKSGAGGAATELVATVADFTRTREAWSRLAQQLKLTDQEAFDTLLGKRVTFAAAELPDHTLDWVILSAIDRDTESRLRSALRAAPRDIAGGLPVLSVENGRFELVLAPKGDDRLLVLAPAGSTGLFESVVANVARGGPDASLADTEPLRRVRALGGAPRALAVFRDDDAWLSVAFNPDNDAIRASFVAGGEGIQTAEVQPWSLDTFSAAADGALFAIVESDSLPANLRIATRVGKAPLARVLMPPDPHRLRGGRVAIRAMPSADGPLDIAVAMQTSSVDRLAVDGDRSVARFLASLKGAADTRDLPYDFAGAAPAATRVVNLGELLPPAARFGWTQGPVLAWNYRSNSDQHGVDRPGWWTIGLGRPGVDQLADILARQQPPDPAPRTAEWLSVGMLRPADIITALQGRNVPLPTAAAAFHWIAKVQWKAIRTPDALIQGDASVELAPAPLFNPAP